MRSLSVDLSFTRNLINRIYQAWTLQHLINIGAKLQKQQRQVILLVNQVDGNLSPSVRKALASASANNLSIQTVDDYSRSLG